MLHLPFVPQVEYAIEVDLHNIQPSLLYLLVNSLVITDKKKLNIFKPSFDL